MPIFLFFPTVHVYNTLTTEEFAGGWIRTEVVGMRTGADEDDGDKVTVNGVKSTFSNAGIHDEWILLLLFFPLFSVCLPETI